MHCFVTKYFSTFCFIKNRNLIFNRSFSGFREWGDDFKCSWKNKNFPRWYRRYCHVGNRCQGTCKEITNFNLCRISSSIQSIHSSINWWYSRGSNWLFHNLWFYIASNVFIRYCLIEMRSMFDFFLILYLNALKKKYFCSIIFNNIFIHFNK